MACLALLSCVLTLAPPTLPPLRHAVPSTLDTMLVVRWPDGAVAASPVESRVSVARVVYDILLAGIPARASG